MFAALANLVLTAVLVKSPFPNLTDDAYISLRYARNASQGLGFVWNPGEQPVEGFTSLLYVLIQVALYKSGSDPVDLLPAIGLGAMLVTVLIAWKIGALLKPLHSSGVLGALVLVAACPAVLFWEAAGLETPLLTLLLTAGVYAFIRLRRRGGPGWLVGVLFGLLALNASGGRVPVRGHSRCGAR